MLLQQHHALQNLGVRDSILDATKLTLASDANPLIYATLQRFDNVTSINGGKPEASRTA